MEIWKIVCWLVGGGILASIVAACLIGYGIWATKIGPLQEEEVSRLEKAVPWLKKWWPWLVLAAMIVVAIAGWKFITQYWPYFLLTDIIVNLILLHFIMMPLKEMIQELEGPELPWLAILSIFFWLFFLVIKPFDLPVDDECGDEDYWSLEGG